MTVKELITNQLQASKFLFDAFSKDFTDADAQVQPCPNGNHLNWMLVHMAVSEDSMIAALTGQPKKLSEALHKSYGGGSVCKADDGMTRAEALKLYGDSLNRTLDFVKTFDESRYNEKAPAGFPPLFPTVGSVLGLLAAHPFWHVGQLTVNRQFLKKPKVLGQG